MIAAQRDEHQIPHATACRALGVSRSWFYKHKGRELTPRQACDHEHTVRRVLALLDRRAESVELGEPASVGVRDEQPDALPVS